MFQDNTFSLSWLRFWIEVSLTALWPSIMVTNMWSISLIEINYMHWYSVNFPTMKTCEIWSLLLKLIILNVIIQEWARMYQNHPWQGQIKIETITSLRNTSTIWLAKCAKSVLLIFSNLVVTFMLLVQQLLICAFQFSGGQIPQEERWYQSTYIWCGNTDSGILSYYRNTCTWF